MKSLDIKKIIILWELLNETEGEDAQDRLTLRQTLRHRTKKPKKTKKPKSKKIKKPKKKKVKKPKREPQDFNPPDSFYWDLFIDELDRMGFFNTLRHRSKKPKKTKKPKSKKVKKIKSKVAKNQTRRPRTFSERNDDYSVPNKFYKSKKWF